MFSHDERSVRRRFNNRKPDFRETRNAFPFVLAIAAGALRAALDNMTGDSAGSEPVPIVRSPSKLMYQWCQRETRVGGASCNYNLCTAVQCFHNRRGAQICVRTLDPVPDCGQRRAIVHVSQLNTARQEFVETAHDVVPGDNSNSDLA